MGIKNKKTSTDAKAANKEPKKNVLKEHAWALKSHLLWLAGTFGVAAIIGFEFKAIIQGLLTLPLADLSLMGLKPAEDNQSVVTVSLFTGALVALPLVTFHAYRFLEPILERGGSYAARLLFGSIGLAIAAVVYVYATTIPLALHGMAAYGQDASLLHITTQSFLSFTVTNILVTVALFQLPLGIIFVNSIQPLSKKTRMRLRYVVLPLTLIAAVLSTPFTSLGRAAVGAALLAVPALVLFEASLFWAKRRAKSVTPLLDKVVEIEQPIDQEEVAAPKTERVVEYAPVAAPIQPVAITYENEQDSLTDMLDAILQDEEPAHVYSPRTELPPQLDIVMEEAEEQKSTPAPVVAGLAEPSIVRTSQTVTVKQTIAPARRSVSSFDVSSARSARPVMQPQPVVRRTPPAVTTKPIVTQEISKPAVRSRRVPQQIVPFRISSMHTRRGTVDGLLAVSL